MVPVHTLVRPDVYPRSSTYDPDWVLSLDMGPHPLWQLEGLLPALQLHRGDRVLDLGCGRGATSVFLAREAGVDVVAFDQWVRAADVQEVIDAAGVTGNVTVVNGDARQLPFGDAEFDAIVSVDAFEYFGTDVRFLPSLLRVLRSGGAVAMSTPALSVDPYLRPPPAQVTALVGWEAAAWHTPEWWRTHWELTGMLTGVNAELQPGSRDDWILWARASGDNGGPLMEMLTSMAADEIGFALVSAAKE